jgi:hypothetical protein
MREKMFEKIAWICIVNLALYLKTLRFKFVSDDFSVWQNPPAFKNEWHKRWLQFTGALKLLEPSVYFYKEKGKWKYTVIKTEEFEHLLALLLHICIGISIYFAFGKNQVSFIAALLYSTNPVNNQGTIWPGGRGYALSILSLLLSISIPFLSPALLYFCSWYPAGFFAPLSLIGSTHWMLLGWIPLIWILQRKKYSTAIKQKDSNESFTEDKIIHPRKLILAIKTFGFYLTLCLIPFRITFYHNFLQSCAGSLKHKAYTFCRYFWIGAISITLMIVCAIMVPCWNPLIWSLFAFLFTILPFCNFRRANQEIAERFAALPNVFLMYGLAQVIAPYSVIVTSFLIFYMTRTFYTLSMYKDEYFITELAVIEDPHAWWAWHCRAMKRWDTQSYMEALILWTMAKLISPKEFKVLMNLASCLRLLKNDKEADHFLKLAEENIVAGQEKEAMEFITAHRKGKLPILL